VDELRPFRDRDATLLSPVVRHAVRLPQPAAGLSERLFTGHRVEIPVDGPANDLLRLSVAAYTTRDEIDRLLAALVRELDAEHRQQDE
jgi:selenocysteine lyase/cysteine desulfurase